MHESLRPLADRVLKAAKAGNLAVVAAESCTAGLLATILADAEGASVHFAGSFVTYTKDQKIAALNVSPALLAARTAVACEVAAAMAEGALRVSAAQIAAAITGVAGPEPDEDGNPVGRVCIAIAREGQATEAVEHHYGALGREAIRERAVADALHALLAAISLAAAA